MSRFAQYYVKYKHDAGCYDWQQRQQHLGALFDKDESIEFYLGEGTDRIIRGQERCDHVMDKAKTSKCSHGDCPCDRTD